MEQQEKEKSIAELWSRFDAIKNRFGSSKDYSRLINISNWDNPAQGRIDWVNEITALHQQLSERCVNAFELHRNFPPDSDIAWIDHHKEMSAYHAWKAWFMEQKQFEKGMSTNQNPE